MILGLLSLALALVQPAEARPPACTAETAVRAAVTEITRRPDRFMGRCVTVAGPAGGTTIYSGVDAIYLGQIPGVVSGPAATRGLIGLYSDGNRLRMELAPERGLAHLVVTGTVDNCERMRDRLGAAAQRERAGNILPIMMGGYCHWRGGPVIRIASYARDPAVRYERLIGEAARARVGDLVMATPRTPGFGVLRDFATAFAEAMRRGNREALARLHDFRPGTRNPEDLALLAYLLDDPESPFASLRRGIGGGPAIFVRRNASIARDEGVSGVICFCRTSDCRGRWPISILDAAGRPDRPYVCTIVEPRNWERRGAGLSTPVRGGGLAEPARSAFRAARNGSTR